MHTTNERPPSRLASLEPAILRVLPSGLPEEVRRFYAEGDGLTVRFPFDDHEQSATLVGLEDMFGGLVNGKLAAYKPVKRGDDLGERLGSGPFEDVFYCEHDELEDRGARARVDLLLRLRLLAQVEGTSSALGIDFYSDEASPPIYLVEDCREPHRLALGFAELVSWFRRFGTRPWYLAFLNKKSERQMNIHFADELARELAPFAPAEVEALRAAGKAALARARAEASAAQDKGKKTTKESARGAPKAEEGAPDRTKSKAKAGDAPKAPEKKKAAAAGVSKEDIRRWPVKPLELPSDLRAPATEIERSREVLLDYAAQFVDRAEVPALVADGLRKHLASKKWVFLDWCVVALAGPCLDEEDVVALVIRFMPADALVVIARQLQWDAARLKKLANATTHRWKKELVDPHVSKTFAEAASLMKKGCAGSASGLPVISAVRRR